MNIENLDKLIAHLKMVPESSFYMPSWRISGYSGGPSNPTRDQILDLRDGNDCGTRACIAGHADLLIALEKGLTETHERYEDGSHIRERARDWLGLTDYQASKIFGHWSDGGSLHAALITLQYLRETGYADWEEAQKWAAKKEEGQ